MPVLAALVTSTHELVLKPQTRRKLLTELKAYAELKAQANAIKHAMDKHKESIGKLRAETGEQTLALEGFKVSLVTPVRSTLDKKLLLEQGVTMGQIENATVVKPVKAYEKVSCPGDRDDDY